LELRLTGTFPPPTPDNGLAGLFYQALEKVPGQAYRLDAQYLRDEAGVEQINVRVDNRPIVTMIRDKQWHYVIFAKGQRLNVYPKAENTGPYLGFALPPELSSFHWSPEEPKLAVGERPTQSGRKLYYFARLHAAPALRVDYDPVSTTATHRYHTLELKWSFEYTNGRLSKIRSFENGRDLANVSVQHISSQPSRAIRYQDFVKVGAATSVYDGATSYSMDYSPGTTSFSAFVRKQKSLSPPDQSRDSLVLILGVVAIGCVIAIAGILIKHFSRGKS
jgi:hypothetical protein